MKEFIIGANEAGQRFDKYLARQMKLAPKSFFYKMMRKKNITLNQKKAAGNEMLAEGDVVKIFLSDETFAKFAGEETVKAAYTHLEIVYEDEDMVLVNKPVDMLSQPDQSGKDSLAEYLTGYLLEKGAVTRESLKIFRPAAVNRLDRNTSGMVACGKSLAGSQELSKMFRERTVHKFYLCVVEGVVSKPSHIKGYLWKDEARNQVTVKAEAFEGSVPIETRYRPLGNNGSFTLLEVELLTGKTHQIRAHLASIGHPLLGDRKYPAGKPETRRLAEQQGITNQLLHAWRLEFPEDCGRLTAVSEKAFCAPLPEQFRRVLRQLSLEGMNL